MANILSASEASIVLRCESTDADMLQLLPLVDAYIKEATGRDWNGDSTIDPTAKAAARILLTLWHEDPGSIGTAQNAGLTACLVQLEAKALDYVFFEGRIGAGPIVLERATRGDTVSSLTGVLNASGDMSASFEEVISISGQIQQKSTADLSDTWYKAKLISLEAL